MYYAYVTEIKELRKHNNADRLQIATVFGNDCIVDLSYNVGDKVVYFPVDGQLDEEFAKKMRLLREKDENGNNIGGYLDPEKRNIKAVKLRGEKSEGLLLKIDCLADYTDVNKLVNGEKISTLNGVEICKKYIPKRQRSSGGGGNGNKKGKQKITSVDFPQFLQHSDTEQLAFNQGAFKPGDTCYITIKAHGTSMRTANTLSVKAKKVPWILKKIGFGKPKEEYKVVSGTRRTVLTNYDGGYYGNDRFREKYHDFFSKVLPKGFEVYYEVVGYVDESRPIMGSASNKALGKEFEKKYGKTTVFSYGCEPGETDIFVYRITCTTPDGEVVEVPWEQVKRYCDLWGVKPVIEMDKFIYTDWNDLMERVERYYDGEDPVGKTHVREGVVVRIDNRSKFTAYKHKNFSFKVLSGIISEAAMEQMQEASQDVLEEL